MVEAKVLLRLGALAVLWGSSFLWIKIALGGFSPVQLVLTRLVLGTLVLALLCAAYRNRLPRSRRIWGHLAVAALLHNALPFLLFAIGEQTIDSGITGALNATTPLWAVLIAWLWGTERDMSPPRVGGLLLGFAGSMLIFAPWQSDGLLGVGAVLVLAAAACYGIALVYEGRYLTTTGSSPTALATAQLIAATGWMIFAMPFGGTAPIRLDFGAIAAVTVLGVASTGIGYALVYRLIADIGAVSASVVNYLLPVVSLLLGTVLLGEQVGWRVIIGIAIVLVGVALTRVRSSAGQAAAAPAAEPTVALAGTPPEGR